MDAAFGRPAQAWAPIVSKGDAHAGWTETSLLLAIEPYCQPHRASSGPVTASWYLETP